MISGPGKKIFVWQRYPQSLSDTKLGYLYATMRLCDDDTPLYVRYRNENHTAGEEE